MNHVTQVSMPRGASPNTTTQTRTFVYNTVGQLTSTTNPENGTVAYKYNADTTLHDKLDAKGVDTVYWYDSLKRVTAIQRLYPALNPANPPADNCQTVTFTYDSNPVNPAFTSAGYGRLTTVQYYNAQSGGNDYFVTGNWGTGGYGNCTISATEMYSYLPAGAVTAKNVQFSIPSTDSYGNPTTGAGNVEVDYTYDQSGRVATVAYPTTLFTSVFTTAYDSMGRPSTLNQSGGSNLASVQYDYAGRETTLSYLAPGASWLALASQTRAYNVNSQLASITGQYPLYPNTISNAGVQYVYSGTQNNGQITQAVDTISGETIGYQYDSLKRLVSAASTPTSGSSAAPWTENFQYDGFGNMTAKTLNGTTTQMPVNSATNQL